MEQEVWDSIVSTMHASRAKGLAIRVCGESNHSTLVLRVARPCKLASASGQYFSIPINAVHVDADTKLFAPPMTITKRDGSSISIPRHVESKEERTPESIATAAARGIDMLLNSWQAGLSVGWGASGADYQWFELWSAVTGERKAEVRVSVSIAADF